MSNITVILASVMIYEASIKMIYHVRELSSSDYVQPESGYLRINPNFMHCVCTRLMVDIATSVTLIAWELNITHECHVLSSWLINWCSRMFLFLRNNTKIYCRILIFVRCISIFFSKISITVIMQILWV